MTPTPLPVALAEPGGQLEYRLDIDFWDAVRGGVKKIQITRMDTCETCHGTGAIGSPQTCPTCNGSGTILKKPCVGRPATPFVT